MILSRISGLRTALLLSSLLAATAQAEPRVIDVHRDASCGCCKNWIRHLQANGFTVRDHVEADMSAVKKKIGVPYRSGSCHTGVYHGKFVEGHVPAGQILKLDSQKDIVGIAVPGMPAGSPGMEVGDRKMPYQVIGLDKSGRDRVMASYPGNRP
jgi:hypothetical protein